MRSNPTLNPHSFHFGECSPHNLNIIIMADYSFKVSNSGKSLLVFKQGQEFLGIRKKGQFIGILVTETRPREVKEILEENVGKYKLVTIASLPQDDGEINVLDVVPA